MHGAPVHGQAHASARADVHARDGCRLPARAAATERIAISTNRAYRRPRNVWSSEAGAALSVPAVLHGSSRLGSQICRARQTR